MSDEFDNNPKATDPGVDMGSPDAEFSDRPAFKRNKPGGPTKGPSGSKYTASGVKSG